MPVDPDGRIKNTVLERSRDLSLVFQAAVVV